MTGPAKRLLDAFDALSASDRHEVAAALLRREFVDAPPDLSDDVLVVAAEELFLELDAAEDKDGKS